MTHCAFRKSSSNPHTGEQEMPDHCRMAHHMKAKGHNQERIKAMALDAELVRVWRKLLPLDVWEAIRECEAKSEHECPMGRYYPREG